MISGGNRKDATAIRDGCHRRQCAPNLESAAWLHRFQFQGTGNAGDPGLDEGRGHEMPGDQHSGVGEIGLRWLSNLTYDLPAVVIHGGSVLQQHVFELGHGPIIPAGAMVDRSVSDYG
jgi:hypothetical protein